MKFRVIKTPVGALALLAVASFLSLPAQALSIDPSQCGGTLTCWTTTDNSNFGTSAEIEAGFGVSFDPDLALYYKVEYNDEALSAGNEFGPFAANYTTTFALDSEDEATGGTIEYDSGDKISCPECYLLVKDGSQDPAQYLISLGLWDGMETLTLSGFWDPGNGAISNVAIWGNVSPIPVPAAIWLFGTALIGFIGISRRTRV